MLKGASGARAHGVLIVKKLNKWTLSILVSNLFLDRQHNISIHRYISCFHEIHVKFSKKYLIGRKSRSDINVSSHCILRLISNYITVRLISNYITVRLISNYITVRLTSNYITVRLIPNYITVRLTSIYITVRLISNYITVRLISNYITVRLISNYITVIVEQGHVISNPRCTYCM